MSVPERRVQLVDLVDQLHALVEQLADPAVDLVPPRPDADPIERARTMLRDVDTALLDLRVDVWRRQRAQGASAAEIGEQWGRTRQHVNRNLRGRRSGR